MLITYREPKTPLEHELVAAYAAASALQTAYGYPVASQFMPGSMDQRRYDKALRRERDANAVRIAQLAQAISLHLAPVDAA